MQEEELSARGDELADALRKMRPALPEAAGARDVWFEAGYRAGRKSLNVWRATAAVLVMGMMGVVAWEHGRQGTVLPQTPVAVEQLGRPSVQEKVTGDPSYARLRDALVREGLRGLGGSELPSGNPYSPPGERSTLKEHYQDIYPMNLRG